MSEGANAVLDLVDSAQAFIDVVEDPAAVAEAVRRFGLAALDAATKRVRAAEGDSRGQVLAEAAEQLGALAAAGALHEAFARAALEEAAAGCGLIRDDGVRAVKKAIGEAVKRGKKQPRDLAEVRGAASIACANDAGVKREKALRAPHNRDGRAERPTI